MHEGICVCVCVCTYLTPPPPDEVISGGLYALCCSCSEVWTGIQPGLIGNRRTRLRTSAIEERGRRGGLTYSKGRQMQILQRIYMKEARVRLSRCFLLGGPGAARLTRSQTYRLRNRKNKTGSFSLRSQRQDPGRNDERRRC